MNNKLLLTLWLIGGVLYAAPTVFLADTLLGGNGSKSDGTNVVAAKAAPDAQCEKENVAAASADPRTTAAVPAKSDPAKMPASQQNGGVAPTVEATAKAAPGTQEGAVAQPNEGTPGQDDPAMAHEDGSSPLPWQNDAAEAPEGEQGTGEQVGEGEWAHVVAGTADMRSEPSLTSPMIYALPSGWQVRVIAKSPGWVQVQDANSGSSGWVEASAIAPIQGRDEPSHYGEDTAEGPDPYAERQRRQPRGGGQFGDFLRRAFGGL